MMEQHGFCKTLSIRAIASLGLPFILMGMTAKFIWIMVTLGWYSMDAWVSEW